MNVKICGFEYHVDNNNVGFGTSRSHHAFWADSGKKLATRKRSAKASISLRQRNYAMEINHEWQQRRLCWYRPSEKALIIPQKEAELISIARIGVYFYTTTANMTWVNSIVTQHKSNALTISSQMYSMEKESFLLRRLAVDYDIRGISYVMGWFVQT